MQIYLPIADLPVNVFLVLAMGLAVGYISGMFGIGGGFLMTPLLIFIGIPPAVAVATVSSHIAASSFTGAISYWRRRALDIALAMMLLSAGIVGTATGVWLFTELRALDQLDLMIGLSYVTLLTAVGGMMIYESLRAEMRTRQGQPATLRRPGSHTWLHGLPFKLRFKRSKIYVSAIPVWAIGFIIGFVGAIMGIGGGFLLVPMLIYFLRVPTATVIGTSMVLTLITMASATVMHAATNHLVDAVLALILMVGGVIGAQFGARIGQKMRGERLRLLLGLLVFAVGCRFAYELVVRPDDLYSLRYVRPNDAPLRAHLIFVAAAGASRPASAERLVVSLSNHRVAVTSNFVGEELVLFGTIEPDSAAKPLHPPYDLVVTVSGPRQTIRTRRKQRMAGIWVNVNSREFVGVPTYLAVLSNRPVGEIAHEDTLRRLQIGLDNFLLPQRIGSDFADTVRDDPFRSAFVRLQIQQGLYRESGTAVTFLTPTVFRAAIPMPAAVSTGTYAIDVQLFSGGMLVARTNSALEVIKTGFEQYVADAARDYGLLYGLATAMMALLIGWFATLVFARD